MELSEALLPHSSAGVLREDVETHFREEEIEPLAHETTERVTEEFKIRDLLGWITDGGVVYEGAGGYVIPLCGARDARGNQCLSVGGIKVKSITVLPPCRTGNVTGQIAVDTESRMVGGIPPEEFIGAYGAAAGHLAEDLVYDKMDIEKATARSRWEDGQILPPCGDPATTEALVYEDTGIPKLVFRIGSVVYVGAEALSHLSSVNPKHLDSRREPLRHPVYWGVYGRNVVFQTAQRRWVKYCEGESLNQVASSREFWVDFASFIPALMESGSIFGDISELIQRCFDEGSCFSLQWSADAERVRLEATVAPHEEAGPLRQAASLAKFKPFRALTVERRAEARKKYVSQLSSAYKYDRVSEQEDLRGPLEGVVYAVKDEVHRVLRKEFDAQRRWVVRETDSSDPTSQDFYVSWQSAPVGKANRDVSRDAGGGGAEFRARALCELVTLSREDETVRKSISVQSIHSLAKMTNHARSRKVRETVETFRNAGRDSYERELTTVLAHECTDAGCILHSILGPHCCHDPNCPHLGDPAYHVCTEVSESQNTTDLGRIRSYEKFDLGTQSVAHPIAKFVHSALRHPDALVSCPEAETGFNNRALQERLNLYLRTQRESGRSVQLWGGDSTNSTWYIPPYVGAAVQSFVEERSGDFEEKYGWTPTECLGWHPILGSRCVKMPVKVQDRKKLSLMEKAVSADVASQATFLTPEFTGQDEKEARPKDRQREKPIVRSTKECTVMALLLGLLFLTKEEIVPFVDYCLIGARIVAHGYGAGLEAPTGFGKSTYAQVFFQFAFSRKVVVYEPRVASVIGISSRISDVVEKVWSYVDKNGSIPPGTLLAVARERFGGDFDFGSLGRGVGKLPKDWKEVPVPAEVGGHIVGARAAGQGGLKGTCYLLQSEVARQTLLSNEAGGSWLDYSRSPVTLLGCEFGSCLVAILSLLHSPLARGKDLSEVAAKGSSALLSADVVKLRVKAASVGEDSEADDVVRLVVEAWSANKRANILATGRKALAVYVKTEDGTELSRWLASVGSLRDCREGPMSWGESRNLFGQCVMVVRRRLARLPKVWYAENLAEKSPIWDTAVYLGPERKKGSRDLPRSKYCLNPKENVAQFLVRARQSFGQGVWQLEDVAGREVIASTKDHRKDHSFEFLVLLNELQGKEGRGDTLEESRRAKSPTREVSPDRTSEGAVLKGGKEPGKKGRGRRQRPHSAGAGSAAGTE
jgi:hypothetical protein